MTDTFTWTIQEKPVGTPKQHVRSAVFGDGYAQDVPDGPNPVSEIWAVSIEDYSANIATIVAFLKAHVGAKFYWTPPLIGVQGYYICTTYSPAHKEADVWTLTATFEQRFAP